MTSAHPITVEACDEEVCVFRALFISAEVTTREQQRVVEQHSSHQT